MLYHTRIRFSISLDFILRTELLETIILLDLVCCPEEKYFDCRFLNKMIISFQRNNSEAKNIKRKPYQMVDNNNINIRLQMTQKISQKLPHLFEMS